jgi:hypothetical protein
LQTFWQTDTLGDTARHSSVEKLHFTDHPDHAKVMPIGVAISRSGRDWSRDFTVRTRYLDPDHAKVTPIGRAGKQIDPKSLKKTERLQNP